MDAQTHTVAHRIETSLRPEEMGMECRRTCQNEPDVVMLAAPPFQKEDLQRFNRLHSKRAKSAKDLKFHETPSDHSWGKIMKHSVRSPFAALALSSLMIGTLHHWGWNIACTGMLFGFAFAVGVKQPRPAWLWLTILAVGAPTAGLLMHAIPGLKPPGSLLTDFGGGALASLGAMIPGLGAGYMFRRLRRLRTQPSMIA